MWEKKSADGGINDVNGLYSWAGAFADIAALNATTFAGHGDWQLPNVRELQSILNYARFNPSVSPEFYNGCVPGASVLTGSCTAFARYWASTTGARTPTAAWAVWFDDGLAAEYFKISPLFVRAVRGGF